jgi:hypothetical protein
MKKFVINSTSILKLYIGSQHFMRENIKWWLLFFFLLTVYKSSHPPVLAQRWMTGLRTRPKNEHKVKRKLHDMRMLGKDCGSAKHAAIRKAKM